MGTKSSPFFQDAYAITMDPASKRYVDIKAFATTAGVPLQPWKGRLITPQMKDTLPLEGVGTTNYKDRTGAVFNLGVIGAFLAHRDLFKHVSDTAPTKPGTLIFEDDVETANVMKLEKDMTATKNWGIWAYIVKNASLKDKVLPRMEHMLDVPDIQLAKFADMLNMYLLTPSIVKQDMRNAPNSVVTVLDQQATKPAPK